MTTPTQFSTGALATRSARVWLVDDSALEREFARHWLAESHDVQAFYDGTTVLELIAGGIRPDVLVLDWHMPTITGIEVCRFLRQTYDAASLPILVLTASNRREDLLEGLAAGANDFVSKGSDLAELGARVATLIQIKRLHDALKHSEHLAQQSREEADDANRAKDVFLGIVSHELRTPLNSILGWSRLLVDQPLDQREHRHGLETIQRNARLQIRLIEDILDTTRIVSGKLQLDLGSIDFSLVVRAAIESCRLSAEAKAQKIEYVCGEGAFPIFGDAERLQQAVGNVLTNAIKFTPEGGQVRVDLGAGPAHWELQISDSGKGIGVDLLPHLFDRFRQQEGATSRRSSGLGLGLSLVRHIVEAHDGEVNASSEGAGRGATFTLRIPHERGRELVEPDSTGPISGLPVPPVPSPPNILQDLNVLIVEDDDDARELLVRVLGRLGAVVRDAASTEAALALLIEAAPDVLISDIGLPDQDGYELVKLIRARGWTAERLPAIALTAYARAEDRQMALNAGFQAYIAKPVDNGALAEVIARVARVMAPTPV